MRARSTRPQPVSARSRAAAFIAGLPDHSLLDRLVRGRAWIPVFGVMLAGIVAMQVEVLKLNASMGRSIALATSLQTRNELLRTSVSSLADAQRIEQLATRMGMVMPGPTAVDFLHGQADAARAAAGIHVPDAAAFDAALQASSAQATPATAPALTSATTTGQPGPSSAAAAQTTTSASTSTPGATAPTTAVGAAATGATATGTTVTGASTTGGTTTGQPAIGPSTGPTTSQTGGAAPAG